MMEMEERDGGDGDGGERSHRGSTLLCALIPCFFLPTLLPTVVLRVMECMGTVSVAGSWEM